MQQPNAVSTRARSAGGTLMQAAFGCCILLLYMPQDGFDTVQLALVVFFLRALAHLLMCTQTNRHTLQLALCGGGHGGGCIFIWWWLYAVVVICGGNECT